ncbi:hypothetical protein HYT45_01175 [Candidatus Uhrbacteria bacterium]|nr:hypothetical protein [Candidatus Uhrbacteria bacterium]
MVNLNIINNQAPRGGFVEWIVLNKLLLKRIAKYCLIVFSIVFWSYGIYGLVDWILLSGPKERMAIARLHVDLVNYGAREAVRPLEVRRASVISNARGDALALIKNPNSRWYATFDYRFLIEGERTVARRGFILPGEEKYIFDLGLNLTGRPSRAALEIKNIIWRRITRREIPDYDAFLSSRLSFETDKISYAPALQVAGRTVSRASFEVSNNSAFGYFEVPFQIFLYRGNVLAGVNQAVLNNFASGETRQVDATWFETISGITKVEVRPDLNIMDDSVYKK